MHEIDMPQETWTRLIKDCDINNDGSIDYEEFHRYLTDQMETQLTADAKLPEYNSELLKTQELDFEDD